MSLLILFGGAGTTPPAVGVTVQTSNSRQPRVSIQTADRQRTSKPSIQTGRRDG